METIRLFDKDSFIKEFDARVISCEQWEERYRVILDQTGFFPEGGGQTADSGQLHSKSLRAKVIDVQEENGHIVHMTDIPFKEGALVTGVLDWKERFSKMQHHTGEHIVSGLVNKKFGYNNVGFHLGTQVVTLDFDGVLTKDQLREVEYEANEAVAANLPVLVTYPTKEELKAIAYRSKIEIEGQVRIVEIPGYDVCACCAPHMHTTGQIGMIKLVNMHNYKGGVRVYMLCGFAALADYCEKEESVKTIAVSMSANESQVAEAVDRLKQEIFRLKGENMALTNELLDYKVSSVLEGAERALFIEESLEGNQPRELMNKLLEKGVGLAMVFAGNEEKGYRYVIGSKTQDVRPFAKELNKALNGRGGGKPEMVQGSVCAAREEIENFCK